MKIVQSKKINHLENSLLQTSLRLQFIKITIYYNLSLRLQLIIKHHY